MDFKWTINKLTVTADKLVAKVDLIVTGTDGNNSASAAYTRNLVCSDSVIAYNQLTEQQILDWCFAPEVVIWADIDNVERTITKHLKNEGEAQVTEQIARQLAQAAAEPALPWRAQESVA